MDIKEKTSINLFDWQIEWLKQNNINVSAFVRELVTKEIEQRR